MIGITDLITLSDAQSATHLGWFVALGRHVAMEPDPAVQRLLATAAHRHAWHAELWAGRRPTIPHDAVHVLPAPAAVDVAGDVLDAYRTHLAVQRALLADLRARADRELDPATHRVLDLVDADLADLADRAARLRA